MKRPSVTIYEDQLDEIDARSGDEESRSKYIRDAVEARFAAEDAGDWTPPDDA